MVIVTATLNRAQNVFEALFTTVMGKNIVTKTTAEARTVDEMFPTVLLVVRIVDRQFLLNPVRIVLIIITVLLIIALTVSISVNRASRPMEKLTTDTMVNALTTEMKTDTAGTSADPTLRKNIHIIMTIRSTVLTSAWTIEPTEVHRNPPALASIMNLAFLGKLWSRLLSILRTLPTASEVPDLVPRPTSTTVVGRLPILEEHPQHLLFSLILVILPS